MVLDSSPAVDSVDRGGGEDYKHVDPTIDGLLEQNHHFVHIITMGLM